MPSEIIERAYTNIREYLPEDARRALSREIPEINKFVDDEMDKFGAELISFVSSEVAKSVEAVAAEFDAKQSDAREALDVIRADIATNDETLAVAVAALEKELDAYEEIFRKAGTRIRQSAVGALQSAGFPVGMVEKLTTKLRELNS